MTYQIWLAPDRNFLLIKARYQSKNTPDEIMEHTTEQWTQLKSGKWFPQKIILKNIKLNYQTTITLSDISEAPLTPADFHPTLPPRTYVFDQVAGKKYEVPAIPTTQP